MDFGRSSSRVSRIRHIKNVTIREIMNVHGTIIDTIGNQNKTPENAWTSTEDT